jgi:alanyl-tRNA synthetase
VARRDRIRANHSATHLLHKALKLVVGETVNQKGSVVSPEMLRFDFSAFSQLSLEQLDQVEDLVNGWVRDNTAIEPCDAQLDGLGDEDGARRCRRTGDIGLFKITQEVSRGWGVRRIVALTGAAAIAQTRRNERLLEVAAQLYKAPPTDLGKRIEATQKRIEKLEKKLASSGAAKASEVVVQEVNGIKVLTQRIDPADAGIFRELADRHRDQLGSGVVGLGGETADGKALILVAVTKDVVAKGFKAGDAIRAMAELVGGKGGGKPDLAQAGGSDPSKIPQAFEKLLDELLGLGLREND